MNPWRLLRPMTALTIPLLGCPGLAGAGSPLDDAVAVWHMADEKDPAGKSGALQIHGRVKLGVELTGTEREASLRRGGDGQVGLFEGGWLVAGTDANGAISLTGHALTICLRLRDPSGRWAAGLLSRKGEIKNYNLFAWDLGRGMEFGFEFNLRGERQFRQVRTPLEGLVLTGWHDLVVRYDGVQLALFVDGVVRDQQPASGQVAEAREASLLIGADPGGENAFHGLVDHAALWNRALRESEIEFLCGGREAVEQAKTLELAVRQESERQAETKLHAARQRVVADTSYPKYHVAPPVGWMNDPHPIYFQGVYHIFYQYSCLPDDPYGGPHRWGHASSRDLVHWRHLPVAITPKDHGIGENRHIWSGCVVDNGGVGTAVYTIENIDVWSSTSSDENLESFQKWPGNPVIHGPPPGLEIEGGMRDPWVWKEADAWYLIVGSGRKGGQGPVVPLYKSSDLVHWEYLHPLYEGNAAQEGGFCECPTFFPLGNKHVLVLSHQATYLVGSYANHRFLPERRGRLDFGGVYVPQSVVDGKGRRIVWGWVLETRGRDAQRQAGWAGMQTLPRILSLQPDGTLACKPAPELASLRSGHCQFRQIRLAADTTHLLERVQGGQLEIAAEFESPPSGAVGLALLAGPEKTEILFDGRARTLACKGRTAPLQLATGEPLVLRVFVDGSVVEVFANDRVCITERIYPAQPDAIQVAVISRGVAATATKVDAWKMGSIWLDERTQPRGRQGSP
jgi:sucrose-6-phosphate hydrolase SacC (GH32 family)